MLAVAPRRPVRGLLQDPRACAEIALSLSLATIQVRDLPEEVYETIRRRARAEGWSLQAYLRERLIIEFASKPTQQELVAEIEQRLAERAEREPDPSQIADDTERR